MRCVPSVWGERAPEPRGEGSAPGTSCGIRAAVLRLWSLPGLWCWPCPNVTHRHVCVCVCMLDPVPQRPAGSPRVRTALQRSLPCRVTHEESPACWGRRFTGCDTEWGCSHAHCKRRVTAPGWAPPYQLQGNGTALGAHDCACCVVLIRCWWPGYHDGVCARAPNHRRGCCAGQKLGSRGV